MSSSAIAGATSQALLMTAASNTFAQGWKAYQKQSLSAIDLQSSLQFIILALLVTPPNYLWQRFLEDTFPAHKSTPHKTVREKEKANEDKKSSTADSKAPLSKTNTAIKFFLDQTLGCWVNTLLFFAIIGMLKGKNLDQIGSSIKNDFWDLVFAGYKLWPAVCLLNFSVVPFEYRMLVGNIAAFGWGVFISLTTS